MLPVLREIGSRWEQRRARASPRSTSPPRSWAAGCAPSAAAGTRDAGPLALLACAPGERHELGLLSFGLALHADGLARALPRRRHARSTAIEDVAGRVVPALSWSSPRSAPEPLRRRPARRLATLARAACALAVGGAGAGERARGPRSGPGGCPRTPSPGGPASASALEPYGYPHLVARAALARVARMALTTHSAAPRDARRSAAGSPVRRSPSGTGPRCPRPTAPAARRSPSARRMRSSRCCARPSQLGLGRAYVDGIAAGRRPRRRARAARRLDAAAARRAARARGSHSPPPAPPAPRRPRPRSAAELVPRGRRHSRERDARAVRHHYDVSNEFFELLLGPSLTYSCAIFSRGATTLEEAQETKNELVCTKLGLEPGPARARRRLRLGRVRHARRRPPRRPRHRHHALRAPGRARAPARRRRRARRPGRHPRGRLPRPGRRALRRGRLDRDGRARRQRPDRRLRRSTSPPCSSPAAGCSTTGSPACATPIPRPARSRSASSSRTPRRCTSRGSSTRSSAPASRRCTPRGSARTTRRRSTTGRRTSTRTWPRPSGWPGPTGVRVWRLYLRAARNGFARALHVGLPGAGDSALKHPGG